MTQTIQFALRGAKNRLQSASDSGSLDAHVLLAAVLGVERAYLLAHPEQPLTHDQQIRYEAFIDRCAAGEPLAYILGRRAFFDREFIVTPDVLIPRPETEHLLEAALTFAHQHPLCVGVDVGTGSGALAVTLAALSPTATIHAVDFSPAALNIARQNAILHQANVQFWEGDLLTPLVERGIKVDLVMANLPYIASGDLPTLAVTRYEPRLALDGGADGLDLVQRLLQQAPAICNPGALLLLEIGAEQGAAAAAIAQSAFPDAAVTILKDLAGLDRIIQIAQ
ncbi:MAG: peptide chain release factor N(5)-glutamine methyltransferase [Anaerolineae bacterium]|nr:peptide chain release factor N(5)-glutamine methyltransferase [Anaerolineae bacterium]